MNSNTRRFSNAVSSIMELVFVLYIGGSSADVNYEYIHIHTPFGELLDGYYTATTSKGTLKIYYSKNSKIIDIYSLPTTLKQILYR